MPTNQINPIIWKNDRLLLLDQRKLPNEYQYLELTTYQSIANAITTMVVRGAPAIGVTAAYGLYLGSLTITTNDRTTFLAQLEQIAEELRQTRPTAVNLFWAISRLLNLANHTTETVSYIPSLLLQSAIEIHREDIKTCQAIGTQGLSILPPQPQQLRILTHCNTGSLATAGYGTALGVIRSAYQANRLERVYADETRPRLQGAKLTVWECVTEGIPVTLITDNMAAHCMKQKMIDLVIVGADRISANGDTANKIGTYGLSIIAKAHQIPFYIAAPISTIDFNLPTGQEIPIEQRDQSEIYQIGDTIISVPEADFYNPAFDVTPAENITGIITEQGVFAPNALTSLL